MKMALFKKIFFTCFLLFPLFAFSQKIKSDKGEKDREVREYINRQQKEIITEKDFKENYIVANTATLLKQLDLGTLPVIIPEQYLKTPPGSIPVKQLLQERFFLIDSIDGIARDTISPPETKSIKQSELEYNLGIINVQLLIYKRYSQCNQQVMNQPVEFYDGSRGASKELVLARMGQIGQLRWLKKFPGFNPATDNEGSVKEQRWGSGCMITKDLYLTAGHCVNNNQPTWVMPKKKNELLPPAELCKLMNVQFNYEYDRNFPLNNSGIGKLRADTCSYPVLELVEYGLAISPDFDYAILRLGKGGDSSWPGEKFGIIPICDSNELKKNDRICIIQHPNGLAKVVGGGSVYNMNGKMMYYKDIDTDSGSSGAPVISCTSKKLVGLHFYGDCSGELGANKALRIDAIRRILKFVK